VAQKRKRDARARGRALRARRGSDLEPALGVVVVAPPRTDEVFDLPRVVGHVEEHSPDDAAVLEIVHLASGAASGEGGRLQALQCTAGGKQVSPSHRVCDLLHGWNVKSLLQGWNAKSLLHGRNVKSLLQGRNVKSLLHGRNVKSLTTPRSHVPHVCTLSGRSGSSSTPMHGVFSCAPDVWTRRVQLVREEGRDVSI